MYVEVGVGDVKAGRILLEPLLQTFDLTRRAGLAVYSLGVNASSLDFFDASCDNGRNETLLVLTSGG